jgi:hypothetical protein
MKGRRAVTCPTGCGSLTFTAERRGTLFESFSIDPDLTLHVEER